MCVSPSQQGPTLPPQSASQGQLLRSSCAQERGRQSRGRGRPPARCSSAGSPAQATSLASVPPPGLESSSAQWPNAPDPTLVHAWAPVGSLTAVHLEDGVCHGCELALPI